jgi:hypothetical protein
MENRKISIIAMAVFMCTILLAQNNIQKAWAITSWNTAFATDPTAVVYSTFFSRYVVIHTGGIIDTVNPVTHVTNTVTLPTSSRVYQASIGCPDGLAYCVVVQDGTTSNDRILTINPITGAILTNTTSGISGFSTVQNGATVMQNGYYIGICTSGSGRVARSVTGVQFGVCGGSTMGAQNILASAIGSTTTAFINDGASGIQVWDNTALTLTCSVAVSVGASGGAITYYNSNYYVVISTTTINKYSQSCGAGTGISGTSLTTQMHGLRYNTARDEFYVVSTTTLAVMNLSSTNISTLLYTVDMGSSAITRVSVDVNTAGEQIARISGTGSGFLYGVNLNDNNNGAGESGGGADEFCLLPENVNILRCRLETIGGGQLGSFSDLVGETFGNSTNNIFVQLGLVQAGSDIKTNGVGYMFVVVALGIMIVMFYLGSGDLREIPTFVWFIGTLSILGGMTAFGFVDITFFLIGVIAIVALASAKIVSTLDLGRF